MSQVTVHGMVARFDEMAWPLPCQKMDELNWRLRYGTVTRSDMLQAAEIIHAYVAMVLATEKKRRSVVRRLREAGAA